jgi:nucleotide-binding universal stress UspA family protein
MRQADLADIADACRERLTRTAGDLAEKGIAVACQVTSGVPYLEILRMAEELHADMIVMGTHGRSGLVHLMIGSVAERVVRKAPCAVLTVKRH